MKRLRVYIDTSVVGGCLDRDYSQASNALIEAAKRGELILVLSELLRQELINAPREVQAILASIDAPIVESALISVEAKELQQAYLDAGVVGTASANDAMHVALATVNRVDVIVSWNFRHIVHLEKIRGFNAVNLREGYNTLEIRTPRGLVP